MNIHWPVGCWSSSNSSVKLSRNEHHLGAGPRDWNNANISMLHSHMQPCHFQQRSHGLKIWPNTSFTWNHSILLHCSHGTNELGWTLTFVSGVTSANFKWCLPTKLPRIHVSAPWSYKNLFGYGVHTAPVKFSTVLAISWMLDKVFSLTSSGKKRKERGKNGSETQISDFSNLLFYLSLVKDTLKQDSEVYTKFPLDF